MSESELSSLLSSLNHETPASKLAWAFRVKQAKQIFSFLVARDTLSCDELETYEKTPLNAASIPGRTELRQEVQALREASLGEKVARARKQKELMSAELARLQERLAASERNEEESDTMLEVDLQAENDALNEALNRVVSLASQLSALLNRPECLLSQNVLLLAQYQSQEEQCAQELLRWKEQNHNSITEPEQTFEHSQELARLKKSFVTMSMRRLDAEIALSKAQELRKLSGRKNNEIDDNEEEDDDEIALQMSSLKTQLKVELQHVQSAHVEIAQNRINRILLAKSENDFEILTKKKTELSSGVRVAQMQVERLSLLVQQLDDEQLSQLHVSNLLKTLLKTLEESFANHESRIAFWRALEMEQDAISSEAESPFFLSLNRAGTHWNKEKIEAEKKREQFKKTIGELSTLLGKEIDRWYPLQTHEKDNAEAISLLNEATKILRNLESRRLAHEQELKLQHPDVVAVERVLFSLFMQEPDNPVRLNKTLARLKDKLDKV